MNSRPRGHSSRALLYLLPLLVLVLGFTFSASLRPGQALFANDGPLGAQASEIYRMPGSFLGIWSDLYWLGAYGGNYAPNATGLLLLLLGPVAFNKFLVPISLMLLGLSAGLFFRQLKPVSGACVLAGLAAALNSNFFSNACWGLSSRALSLAAAFLSLAAIQSSFDTPSLLTRWIKIILAGLAIGLSVSEGGDNGAIFSLFVAAYAFYGCLLQEGLVARRSAKGIATVAVMAVFAAILAAQTVAVFLTKDVKGTLVDNPAAMGKAERWNWATQWSLPKMESLRVVVPGLYGYRLDTPSGGDYWGSVGQEAGWEEGHKDPAWVKAHPNAFPRHSGAGEYAGVLVVLVALWALVHSFAAQGGSFSSIERRMVWFWGGAALVALLLSWGRHAPFYQFIYALPYFSTIRNPMKFMHPFHMAVMILFAYGLQGIWRRYLEPAAGAVGKFKGPAALAEKRWFIVGTVVVGVSILSWLVYASAQTALSRHLVENLAYESDAANAIAKFSSGEVGWSVFFLCASAALLFLITRGTFAGPRAVWAGVLLAVILVADLGRANAPWIKYYDYKTKYANNGVLKILADKPYEHRVTAPAIQWDRNYSILYQLVYGLEWLQNQFPYYNIQSLDQPQDPRPPADKVAYRTALGTNIVRLWELTNTRFILGTANNFVEVLNQQLDPGQRRFRIHTRFNVTQDSDRNIAARIDDNGSFALIEFTGALPRASLYTRWQISTNDQATLATLANPTFDPHQEVIVAGAIPAATNQPPNAAAGSVEFSNYSSKKVVLKANSGAPSILLLNDKVDPNWKATVDGHSAQILRCNFLMRGVQLPAGQHTVEFRYEPPSNVFLISLVATLFGLALCVVLWVTERRQPGSP